MNNSYKLGLILIYLFCSQSGLYSQTFPYYHYTSNEGLASSQVYEMIQDRNGFMWFATANGVSKFDGHNFKNYTTSDGLNSNSIICLTEGNNGEIYLGNERQGFNIYHDDKINKYSYQTEKNQIVTGLFTMEDTLYSYYENNVCKVTIDYTMNLFNNPFYPDTILINKMVNLSDNTFLTATSRGVYKFENQKFEKLNISGLEDQQIFWICRDRDNNILLGAKGKIYEVKDNGVVRVIDVDLFENNNVFRLMKDSKGNIWFSISNRGFFYIPAGTDIIEDMGKKVGLEKKIVNNFLEDNEGNIWISTYGEGVYSLNNLYLNNYSQKDGLSNNKVLSLEKDPTGRMFVGTLDGLNVLDHGHFTEIINKNSSIRDYMLIYSIKCMNDSIYVCCTLDNQFNKISESGYKNDKLFSFISSSFCITKDNKFIKGGWGNDIYTIAYPPSQSDENSQRYLFGDTLINNKVHNIFEDTKSNLWVGTNEGLCKITNGEKTFFSENEILDAPIKYITEDRYNKIWFAGDKGISSYSSKDSLITNYSEINEYDLSSSNALSVDKYNRLWIGSMNGLYILDSGSVKVLNTQTGLPSNEILSLCYDTTKNYMWIGTSAGLSSFDISAFDDKISLPVNVKIMNVTSEDSVYSGFENIVFGPHSENIHLDFTSVNYSSPSSVEYQYKLNEEWIDLPNDYINFSSLEKGDYNLSIRGKAINTSWGEPKVVSFTVLPSFTETFYFRSAVAGLIIFGIVFGASKRIKYIKAREKEKFEINNQVNDLKHKALSSMMNPHFIFNSLNSVQHLVNSDRKREANDYISLMAKLIRMNLETASESYIRLDDEIKRLELYLQIEKLRFSEKFDYEITIGRDIDPEAIMIPNMIIQPFVENSIWHGIMPSGRDGYIKLTFDFENVTVDDKSYKFFTIRITDNGIGLTEAQKNKKDGHISKGIQIIQERLVLLSRESKLPRPIFEDLNSKNNDTHGTEVVLSIPPELYRTISN
jgi:ligand-binding sensor domain-containing protein/two-component sensor histidine kinase